MLFQPAPEVGRRRKEGRFHRVSVAARSALECGRLRRSLSDHGAKRRQAAAFQGAVYAALVRGAHAPFAIEDNGAHTEASSLRRRVKLLLLQTADHETARHHKQADHEYHPGRAQRRPAHRGDGPAAAATVRLQSSRTPFTVTPTSAVPAATGVTRNVNVLAPTAIGKLPGTVTTRGVAAVRSRRHRTFRRCSENYGVRSGRSASRQSSRAGHRNGRLGCNSYRQQCSEQYPQEHRRTHASPCLQR